MGRGNGLRGVGVADGGLRRSCRDGVFGVNFNRAQVSVLPYHDSTSQDLHLASTR